MPQLDPAITLEGHVDDFSLDGFEVEALNFTFERLKKGNLVETGDALYIGEQAVRHYTWRDKSRNRTCSMFYTYGNSPEQMHVYAIGKHHGDSGKEYSLVAFDEKKERLFTLDPNNRDPRYRSLLRRS